MVSPPLPLKVIFLSTLLISIAVSQDYSTCRTFDNEVDCLTEIPRIVAQDQFAQALGYNYTCFWNGTICSRLTCGEVMTEEECVSFDTETYNYACAWDVIDGVGTCYNDCPKKYELVFTIDTSLSVVNDDPNNRLIQYGTIISAMDFVWELSKLQNAANGDISDAENAQYVKFGLVTFSGEDPSRYATVQFDLNNDFESLEEYEDTTTTVFTTIEYMDGTPTPAALNETIRILKESPFDRSDATLRGIAALITDGRPNEPGTGSNPCLSFYNFPERLSEFGLTFYGIFIGDATMEDFDCFTDYEMLPTVFREIETFSELSNTFDLFATEVCQGPFSLPTEAPSESPTNSPTPSPTPGPTPSPTPAPAPSPTESMTNAPTTWWTSSYTDKWSKNYGKRSSSSSDWYGGKYSKNSGKWGGSDGKYGKSWSHTWDYDSSEKYKNYNRYNWKNDKYYYNNNNKYYNYYGGWRRRMNAD